tara:strand:+ start:875 stop:1282 length:408 start_codon:yes stop_codon:yes gene_type:complete
MKRKTMDTHSGMALKNKLSMPTLNGHQRLEFAEKNLSPEQLMLFHGYKPASRITVPLCNRTHIRDCIQVLRNTANELDNLIRGRTFMLKTEDKKADDVRKIVMAQLIVTGAGQELKRRASPSGHGFPDGAFMKVR